MTFVTAGLAVAGLVAIAIPILIHLLFRRRKRPVEFAAMRFLLEAFRRQRRRLRLEQWLLLAVRCLLVALLGFALARPILSRAGLVDAGGNRVVLLVIDNGLASGVAGAVGEAALAEQLERAREVVESLEPTDAVGVVAAARPVDPIVLPPTIDHAAASEAIEAIRASATPSDLPAALSAIGPEIERARSDGRAVVAYLLSDFRAGSARLDVPAGTLATTENGPDDLESVILLASPPATTPATNVQVTAIDPLRRLVLPGSTDGSGQVTVRLARVGGDLPAGTTRVLLQSPQLPPIEAKSIEWSPGESEAAATFTLDYTAASAPTVALTAQIDTAGGDAIAADNRRHVVIDVRDRVRVVLVAPPSFGPLGMIERLTPAQWIRRALTPVEDAAIEVVDADPATLAAVDLRAADVAVVTRPDALENRGWEALNAFLDRGGVVVITPPADRTVHPWVDRLRDELDLPWRVALEAAADEEGLRLAAEQPESELMRMLAPELGDLAPPVVAWRRLVIDEAETRATPILRFEDGSLFAIAGSPQRETSERDADAEVGGARDGADAASPSRGLAVLFAAAPELSEWTNLPGQPLMVPLMQETVRQGLNLVRETVDVTAGERPALVRAGAGDDLLGPDETVIPIGDAGRPAEALRRPGVYRLRDAADRPRELVAVNVEPAAGNTAIQPAEAVEAWLDESGEWAFLDEEAPAAALASAEAGLGIARMLLIALLVLAILEMFLARRFSHADRSERASVLPGGLRPTLEERSLGLGGRAA